MKRISTVTAISFFNVCLFSLTAFPSFAQSPCDNTQVTLSSQEEVNNFPSQFCSTLCSLEISGSDITNLDSLYVLERVGQLTIQFNPMLVDIDGLSNLTGIEGTCSSTGLFISGNNLLAHLDGLSGVEKISGPLIISSNTMLQDLDGLSNLDSIGIGADFSSGGDLSINISSNASLDDIDALSGIRSVDGIVTISGNPALTNVDGLSSLSRIGPLSGNRAALSISYNDALQNLNGLSALTMVNGYVIINNNNDLTSILGLANMSHIGQWITSSMSLEITNNAVLPNVNGLQGIDTIPGTLSISGNATLQDLDGLSSLRAVWKEGSLNTGITIANNEALHSISGLSGLVVIGAGRGSHLHIDSNPVLESVGLNSLTSVQGALAGNITISNNAALGNLDGLSSLQEILGGISASLEITNNASLQHIDGLSSLTTIVTSSEQGLLITDNPTLGRFCGLYTLFHNRGIGCGSSPECYRPDLVVIERNERNPTPEEIETGGPCNSVPSQPTGLVFSQVTSEGMTVTFNHAPTFASGYIVLMKTFEAPAPAHVPQDGTSYNVGEVLGNSTIVVHTGLDTTFRVSGLVPSVPYYFDVFSWSNTENGPDYLTVDQLEGNQTTTAQAAFASSMTFTDVTSESMTVSLEDPQSGHYITLMKAYGYPSPNDVPVNGREYGVGATLGSSTIVVNKGDGSPFTVSWLMPDTRYYFDTYKFDPSTLVYEPSPSKGDQSTNPEASGARTVAMDEPKELVPYPNPVESQTSIPFRVAEPLSTVHVVIYDLAGREVDVLVSGSFEAGLHAATWDGEDMHGRRVQPGMYVYSVKSPKGVVTGRLSVR